MFVVSGVVARACGARSRVRARASAGAAASPSALTGAKLGSLLGVSVATCTEFDDAAGAELCAAQAASDPAISTAKCLIWAPFRDVVTQAVEQYSDQR